jgi:hypothetical protein
MIAISCRNSRSTTGRQYPSTPTTTKAPSSTQPVVVVDGGSGNLPPGQAKKIYGDKSAKAYAPGQRKKHPLIIVYSPGIVISRYSDGRYYYKSKEGYTYWKGHDGRYYIDERHLKGMEYEAADYDEWKVKGQKNDKAGDPKAKDHEVKAKNAEPIAKGQEQKGNGQSQEAKGNDKKEKDQADQDNKDNNSTKGNDKAKGNDKKEKDQADQDNKDNNSTKGNAKAKGKS